MADAIELEETSTITAKGQTTVPKSVRQALGIEAGDRIVFRVDASGVTVRRAESDSDPVVGSFLSFLARDIQNHPDAVRPLTPELARRIADLTAGIDTDSDEAIEGDVAL